jgi:hypothetical protein
MLKVASQRSISGTAALISLVGRFWVLPTFCRDNRGSITIFFAISLVMILTAIGARLDLSRTYKARQ